MKTKTTIHKKNELVRGTDDYSLMAKRALNTIYWAIQKHKLYNSKELNIRFSTLREKMNLTSTNDYVEDIKNALIELRNPMELNHYYNPMDKREYLWLSISFLDKAGFFKNKQGEWIVNISVNPLIKHLMQIEGNFTKLELLPYLHKFRTKYATKLYEYLQSFKGYRYLDISQKHLMQLLALSDKSKYKYYSQLKELIERQLREISKKSDLTDVKIVNSKVLSKEKKFRIQINPKSKKDADKLQAQSTLESLIKRF
jgi:hypothetical protein